eukprot:4610316-Pyramimonas_sp.AAC.1
MCVSWGPFKLCRYTAVSFGAGWGEPTNRLGSGRTRLANSSRAPAYRGGEAHPPPDAGRSTWHLDVKHI